MSIEEYLTRSTINEIIDLYNKQSGFRQGIEHNSINSKGSQIMRNIEDPREKFRESIYIIIEYMIKYELSPSARSLVNHYFNSSRARTTQLRALEAIEKYTQEKIPSNDDCPPKLTKMLEELSLWAKKWDSVE